LSYGSNTPCKVAFARLRYKIIDNAAGPGNGSLPPAVLFD